MNLYLLGRPSYGGHDTYSAAVVAAKTKAKARHIHPSGNNLDITSDTWVKHHEVDATFIGRAKRGTKAGVICASFNAG